MNLTSEQSDKIATALNGFQSELKPCIKSARNPYFKSEYATLEAVQVHIQPILAKHGLSYTQIHFPMQGKPYLITKVFHTSGQWIQSVTEVIADKHTPQAFGSGTTYARRYALVSIFGVIVVGEDDDAEQAMTLYQSKNQPRGNHGESDIGF